MLYIVGTPIGNFEDFSFRAKRILESADIIACEDTRVTGLLLSDFGIKARLTSYHEHNKFAKGASICEGLKSGQTVALVSDAGMPCISDPGYELVKTCIEEGIEISVVPGPTALSCAIALSGLPSDHFYFEGFLPAEGSERKKRLAALQAFSCMIILYEAPHRLEKTLRELCEKGFSQRQVAVAREITKKYEEVKRGSLESVAIYYETHKPKGEFVIIIGEGDPINDSKKGPNIEDRILELHSEGLPTKEISAILSKEFNESKRNLYTQVLKVIEFNKK
ncbi:MAG: 16S rRNA (cytidine(1402)-2'-O)-methyltransferase [Clostridiaceae bacterium]|nr:16S rRNA (cytidine(1402)-2'-O)-methyltransferase [Clostridiaceae bacterium]